MAARTGIWFIWGHQPCGRHTVRIQDRIRRLGWLGLWLAARLCTGLWLTAPNSAGSETLVHDRWDGRRVDEPSARVRTTAVDTTHNRSCSRGSS